MVSRDVPEDLTERLHRFIIGFREYTEKRPIFGDGHRIIDNVPDGDSGGGSSGGSGSGEPSQENTTESGISIDSNGVPYKRERLWLPKDEYAHVMREINTRYDTNFKGKRIGFIDLSTEKGYFSYRFEIHDYNEYNIFDKEEF